MRKAHIRRQSVELFFRRDSWEIGLLPLEHRLPSDMGFLPISPNTALLNRSKLKDAATLSILFIT
jgi:hypothetical protein